MANDGSGIKSNKYKITGMKGTVKKLTISGKKEVRAGHHISLKKKVTASKGANTVVKWKVDHKEYAAVDSKGKVTAHEEGAGHTVKVTLYATDGSGKKATKKIKIYE